jgi:hypothetical protein
MSGSGCVPGVRLRAGDRALAKAASAPNHTAHVLPAPVAACSKPLAPRPISAHTSR